MIHLIIKNVYLREISFERYNFLLKHKSNANKTVYFSRHVQHKSFEYSANICRCFLVAVGLHIVDKHLRLKLDMGKMRGKNRNDRMQLDLNKNTCD